MRRIFSIAALMLLFSLIPASYANAQTEGERCFPETGFCISGRIRSYWEANGGLAVFGFPITDLHDERIESWVGPVQWFERDRLEDHSNEGKGVLAGRLGAEWLQLNNKAWTPGNQQAQAGCEFFAATGYTVCGEFLEYWKRGGGLERFGYPITAQQEEEIEGRSYPVQYFERRRLELHAENAPPHNVLLGLLGKMVYQKLASTTCAEPIIYSLTSTYKYVDGLIELGCPLVGQDYRDTPAALARFEQGEMIWINLRAGEAVIYVIMYESDNTLSYRKFSDTWREGEPIDSGLTAPEGMYEPRRGFGKIWRENEDIRKALGWAIELEKASSFTYQIFERGEIGCPVYGYNRGCLAFIGMNKVQVYKY